MWLGSSEAEYVARCRSFARSPDGFFAEAWVVADMGPTFRERLVILCQNLVRSCHPGAEANRLRIEA